MGGGEAEAAMGEDQLSRRGKGRKMALDVAYRGPRG